ncbi:N-acetyltransferase [Micrococcaceae bacterium Sec5.7]
MTEQVLPGIRRLAAADWEALRAIRLEMIADTPKAYVESLESARAQSDAQWRHRAEMMAGPSSITLVADGREEDCSPPGNGFFALMRVVVKVPQDGNLPKQAMLVSVYVAPGLRGSGLADEMLRQSVCAAANELGAGVLELGVHEDNARAMAFYVQHGFTDTGRREPYPLDRSSSEIIMELPLVPSVKEAGAS